MSPIVPSLVFLLLAAAAPAPPDGALRAQELLAQARQALGGAAALGAVQGLTLEGEVRRRLPGGRDGSGEDVTGSVRVDALRPGRYLRIDTLAPAPGLPGLPLASGLDGDQAWGGPLPVASGPHMVIRTPPPGDVAAQARLQDRVRRESALFLLATLLALDEASAIQVTAAGEAEAPEGKADVLDVTGAHGLEARLFLDQKTHRPLMLTFRETLPRMMMRRAGHGERPPHGPGPEASPPPAPAPSEATLFLSDWKTVGGVLLPHLLTKSLDGKPYEEIVVSRWVVNDPKLTPDKFKKRV